MTSNDSFIFKDSQYSQTDGVTTDAKRWTYDVQKLIFRKFLPSHELQTWTLSLTYDDVKLNS